MMTAEKQVAFDGEKYGYDESYIQHRDLPIWHERLEHIFKLGHRSGSLLDIGCNYGFFLKVCEPYFKTYGIDISQFAVTQARNNVERSSITLGDLEKGLPYKDETFNVVTAFDIIEHIKDYGKLLKEIIRTLKPGGVFLLTTPNRQCIDSLLFGKDYWFKRDKTHVVVFTKKSLAQNLSQAGFTEIRVRTISLLHFLGGFIQANVVPIPTPDGGAPRPNRRQLALAPFRPLLRKMYQLINDLPTPWGANLYAYGKKEERMSANV